MAPNRRTTIFEMPLPSIPVENTIAPREMVKYGCPYNQLDRVFIGLHPSWNGIDAIEFRNGTPVGYLSHYNPEGKDIPLQRLTQVSHPSFLAFKEVFVSRENVYFLYGQWGVTLHQIRSLSPLFQLGEAEVAIICKKILEGLVYIHKDLNIFYGNLKCSDIIITDEGHVKIVGLGRTVFQKPGLLGKNRDVQDVCEIARLLLEREDGSCGPLRLLAQDFMGAPPTATAETLLKHPYLQVNAPSWCLRTVPILYSIAQQKKAS
ncbi:hypothetical protein ASPCAL15125 [Aspergillus calidoustus]|uniref:Protein kinase domain-containing protein n=1 Tax=Aspergillus calidoustus TaxID=454130 RepID=A0A0U5GJS2_ASPCI|nr:hypothetical protein ASPCAL15125 [Aspergillus calidoustus]